MNDYAQKWLRIGRAVGDVNAQLAEQAVRERYKALYGTVPPIEWCDTPAEFQRYIRSGYKTRLIAPNQLISKYNPHGGQYKALVECRRLLHQILRPLLAHLNLSENMAFWGQHMGGELGLLEWQHAMKKQDNILAADALIQLGSEVGWVYSSKELIVLMKRPTRLSLDDQGRLHNENDSAIVYNDFGLCCWHGRIIPTYIVLNGPTTLKTIAAERNIENRHIMIERMGHQRYVEESGLKPRQQDRYGVLYSNDIDYAVVKVLNSTPEPDGSYRTYWLNVPPTMKTAHEAVAWTFGLIPQTYHPLQET